MNSIDYYDRNAERFSQTTLNVDLAETQERFIKHVPEGGYILDFGCGAGRDTAFFISKGFKVDATDGSETLCKLASENTGIKVRRLLFHELDECEKYDGIWACASVLHVEKSDLEDIFHRMARALKPGRCMYVSFKYGEFEGLRGERHFTDFTESSFNEWVAKVRELKVIDMWVTHDVRPGREDEKWLNVILEK